MKWTKRLACAVLAGACALSAAGAADTTGKLSPQGAKAYLDILNSAIGACGAARVEQDGPYTGMWAGISLARLVDFDGDGAPELYYAGRAGGGRMFQRLFAYRSGKAVRLEIPNAPSNFGTDVSPSTLLYLGADKAYLVDGNEVMNGGAVTYYTVRDGALTAALTYTDADAAYPDGTWGAHACTLNGEAVSYEELQKELAAFTAGMEKETYSYWSGSDLSGALIGTVEETAAALRALTNPTARISAHRVTVDGKPVSLAALEIGGSNYFRLRDFAYAMIGTAGQFEVTWNGAEKRIDLTSGKAYTPAGGEQAALPAGDKSAVLTDAAVCLDGENLALTAYNIAGSNYFKLRDLGAALGFDVEWDDAARLVKINTANSLAA